MRIVYIYPALGTVGGADRVIIEKANYFAEYYKYEVYIITAHQCGSPIFYPLSSKVTHWDLNIDFNAQYQRPFFHRAYIYIKLLRRYKEKLTALLLTLKANFVITTISRDIDFLYKIKDGSLKIAEAHIAKEYIRNMHLLRDRGFLYKLVAVVWTKKLERNISRMDALVVLTDKDAKSWKKIRNAITIPNPYSFYSDKASDCKPKRVISVGRLDEQKGYDRLIDSWGYVFEKHPAWKLFIYGNGTLKNDLLRKIASAGLINNIEIKEPVTNIIDKYLESSIYVMSSRFEGFGLVLIEAMTCGLPVISFDCPEGPSEIIQNGYDGYLVKDGDLKGLAEKINFLIEQQKLRIEIGQHGRESVKRYAPNIIMQKWKDLFDTLLD